MYKMLLIQSEAKQEEIRKKQEQMRNEWQPPKDESSSDDETDDELAQDVDLHRWELALSSSVEIRERDIMRCRFTSLQQFLCYHISHQDTD